MPGRISPSLKRVQLDDRHIEFVTAISENVVRADLPHSERSAKSYFSEIQSLGIEDIENRLALAPNERLPLYPEFAARSSRHSEDVGDGVGNGKVAWYP